MSDRSTSTQERPPRDRRRQLEALLRKKAEQSRSFPLSFAQQRLWILDRFDPGNPVYNIPLAMRLHGPLDLDALHRTLDEVVARHESLRTRIAMVDDQPVQVIEAAKPQKLAIIDLEHIKPAEREAEALARVEAEVSKPFRLDEAPLFRVLLLRFSSTEHVMAVVVHHIISDEWSMGVLFREVALLYPAFQAGQPSPLEPLPIQYADYAVWQRQRLEGETLQRLLDYWCRRLQGVAPLEMPTDQPRSLQLQQEGDTEDLHLPRELADRLREVGRREGATLYMTLLAALQVLLHRYSGQEDFAIGSPIAGRAGKETEGLVGFFVNTLVMRADLAGNPSFRSLVRQTRQTAVEAFQHQELPFERLVDALNPQRDAHRNPLFQVMLTLQNAPVQDVKVAGISLSVIPLYSGMAKFDLSFTVREEREGLWVYADYRSDLFRPGTIQRMLKHFRVLLEGMIAEPDLPIAQLELLTEAERRQQLIEWNDTARDYPAGLCVHEWFERQAEQAPHALALIDGSRQWTYQELDERANRLACYLQRRGVGPDQIVAVRLTRSAEWVVALLGILKAGGAYLPLDPDSPAERMRFTLEDARAEILLTQRSFEGGLPTGLRHVVCLDTDWDQIANCPAERPARQTTSDHLAYVIYTSGSTGRPKGVMIEHRALMNYTQAAVEQYGITAADRVLQFAAASFDAHVEEVFPCLTRGGALVLRNDDMLDCRTFLQLCQQWQLTFVTLPTGFWHELTTAIAAERLAVPATLRLLVIGGEQALPERVATWFRCVGSRVRLLNTYGPTETTVVATAAELGRADGREKRVPIGRPLGNMRVYVLDRGRQPVPVGVPGELYIGGESLARGYLNRPELTEERFPADPFAARAGARMYKTGDLVRWRGDGRLEFVGRTDHQVKIRGFRIEPGEVEHVLREHPALSDAAVAVRQRAPGDLQLVAYLSGRQGGTPAAAEMRQFLRERLPEFMVPTAFVALDRLPITASGKVDRRALPDPDWSGEGVAREGDFVAPRTPIEGQLAAIWSEVLHVDRIGAHDNFFDLGGNSLLAMQLTPRVRKAFSIDLPLVTLFTAPRLSELAEQILVLQASPRPVELPSIQRTPRNGPLLASFAQERFWFVQQLAPQSSMLNLHGVLEITGPLDVDTLREAINDVVRRHESLRTTFAMSQDGRLVQVVVPQLRMELFVEDLCHVPQSERAQQIQERSQQQAEEPFDLGRQPLLRTHVLRLGDSEHALLVTAHHIICDGWSLDVLSSEVAQSYAARQAGRPSPLVELPVQYADYAVWQRNYLEGEVLESHLGYWRNKLEGLTPLELPTDRPRRSAELREQRLHWFEIPPRLKVRLDRLSSEEGVTPYMLLLAAFQVLLHRYSDAEDVAVGSPVANRRQPDTQNMIGLFVNTLVLRTDLSSDPSFRTLLARVRQTAIEAYEHQELPFERLVEELQPERDLTRHPLVQVLFDFEQRATAESSDHWQETGLSFQAIDAVWEAADVFDLVLWLGDGENGLEGEFAYDSSLFDEETVARMAAHFQTLLDAVAADPDQRISQLPLLAQREREQVLVEWNRTQVDLPQACVHQLFETQVQRAPDALALVFEGRTMNYRQLNARANQLAHYLAGRGVGPEVLVGICLEPSLDLPVALLGVLKAGGMYLPLDYDEPRERLDYFIEDSRPAVILTRSGLADRFSAFGAQVVHLDGDGEAIARESQADPPCRATPENAVSVMYTSGSTGKPKGAVNRHRGIANYLLYKRQLLGLGPADRVLFVTPISFDTSVEEFFSGLICGGCLVIAKTDAQRDPGYLTRLIAREHVTTACFVPTMLRLFLEDVEGCGSLKRVISGGEALTPDLMERFFQRLDAELYNDYGPTETSIAVSTWKCRLDYERGTIPIGRAISNVRLYILDSERKPVPVGVPGELYIGGVAVGRGYLNRPELNAERFLPDSFSGVAGDLVYRTGDRCRWLSDGNIEFLGRRDGQVKIYGARVELGEVESVLCGHPDVAHAAAVVRQSSPGFQFLAAYVVPRGRRADSAEDRKEFVEDLKRFLKSLVPAYLVPQAFEILDALPQLPSGKVNRAALPAVAPAAKQAPRYVAPRSPLEQQLAVIWAELLRRDRVGVHDNFFELGGHSLLAVRMMVQARSALGITLPVTVLFAAPTVAELAERIEAARRGGDMADGTQEMTLVDELAASLLQPPSGGGQSLVPLRTGGAATPLFCFHGLGGHIAGFLPLARGLAEERPVYGLQAQGLSPDQQPHNCIEAMAAFYLQEIRPVRPHGPYLLAGWSLGGLIALEAAQRLSAVGEEVALVAMFDTYLSAEDFSAQDVDEHSVIRWLAPHLNLSIAELKKLPPDQQWERVAEQAKLAENVGAAEIRRLAEVCTAHLAAFASYSPRPYQGRAVLFQAEENDGLDPRWKSLCRRLRMETVPGNHYSMLRKPHVDTLTQRLDRYLQEHGWGGAVARNP